MALDQIPDPFKTHFLWGFSKDFGMASFRYGVIHTLNEDLMTIMNGMSLYTSVEGHIQQIGAKMLSDKDWLENSYFPTNDSRLRQAFQDCSDFFKQLGCKVHPSKAGLFAWIDFSPFFKGKEISSKTEKEMFIKLFTEYKIYIPNGGEFECLDPGWFRIIFAVKRSTWQEFTRRFAKFVAEL